MVLGSEKFTRRKIIEVLVKAIKARCFHIAPFLYLPMRMMISPAKTLDFESDLEIGPSEKALFEESSQKVVKKLASFKPGALMKLQGISKALANVNYERNQALLAGEMGPKKQAALAFKGDVYLGMEAERWSEADMDFAVQKLFILSGLYGILRPNTLVSPYRLEMGTAMNVGRKKNLYEFWKDDLHDFLKADLKEGEPILNLASTEYFKAVKQLKLANPVIDVDFLDYSKGKYKVISFFAKKARGMMANYIIQNRLDDWRELKDFNLAGYYFDPKQSSESKLVFLRDKA